MPTRAKIPAPVAPPNVARLSVEEQIGSLVHWYEGFADWRIQVDERLERGEENSERLNLKVDGLDSKLGTLDQKMEERHTTVMLIQQQVLIAVQGQRIPGMERPGLSDDLRALVSVVEKMQCQHTETLDKLHVRLSTMEATDTSRKGWAAGVVTIVTVIGGLLATYFYSIFHNLLNLMNTLPLH